MPPSLAALRILIERCGLRLSNEQYEKLWTYHGLLRSANAELNLTRIHNFENMVLKHYVDSLLVLKYVELPSPLVDMGSGPGLPGIPLKIARPNVRMILAEPRGARVEFLKEVVDRLRLKDVEVHSGKVGARFPFRASGVITRAVAAIPETLDMVADCLEPGGRMIFMKGPDCDEEIARAAKSSANSFRFEHDHRYAIPGTSHHRRLIVYGRLEEKNAGASYPRLVHEGITREVTSEENPSLKLARECLTGKGIRKHGRAILAGKRSVAETIRSFPETVEAWMTDMEGAPPPPEHSSITWLRLARPFFRELDVSGTGGPLLLVRTPDIPAWKDGEDAPKGVTLFVPFQDPENVGAVIRSAAAFGAARVVLLKESAHPFHPKSVRAAGTALFQVKLMTGPTIEELRAERLPLIALATEGPELDAYEFPETFGLVAGLEGPGLTTGLREGNRVRIPIEPGVESLNAAAAVAVALYAWRTRRGKSE